MIHHAFPDLAWLKKQTELAFPQQQSGLPKKDGWPLVVMNTRTAFCDRPDIRGPFSIFTNVSGCSSVSAGGRSVNVTENSFFISNREQQYTLQIDNPEQTETLNLHLGQDLWEEFVYARSLSDTTLLDNPFCLSAGNNSLSEFPNALQLKSEPLQQALAGLHRFSRSSPGRSAVTEEQLLPVLEALLGHKAELHRRVRQLPAAKASARAELFRRVSLATDYLLSHPHKPLKLDELAQLACLSKFHFLRAFTAVHGTTPHQYLLQYRMQQACRLLERSRFSVGEVALFCGYPDLAVFSRTFRKSTGASPQQFRQQLR